MVGVAVEPRDVAGHGERAEHGGREAQSQAQQGVALAGDVTVKVKHGSLILTGGSADDAVTIDDVGLGANEMRVTPDMVTTVNGGGAVVFTGITRDVRADLGGGGDAVRER